MKLLHSLPRYSREAAGALLSDRASGRLPALTSYLQFPITSMDASREACAGSRYSPGGLRGAWGISQDGN